jgi:hypothetical protein
MGVVTEYNSFVKVAVQEFERASGRQNEKELVVADDEHDS